MILEQAGRWRIRALVVDEVEAEADAAEARRAGRSWMPEHYDGLGKPTGTIHIDAASPRGARSPIQRDARDVSVQTLTRC
jgi:hypothetical protein